ncbi:ABC-2 type transport system ATP-binding protein [Micromonospora phaseoli]|uniref:ABC-2 type transport system ATP-binding protein n=1 Tax=Micromonospora phaseoli TaxID=1144548 RepID=A0A1H6SW76_9ACTN|nr:ATP-binding cassette domain-containing protein [Micromonospora phaseoli]PZW03996.1 ABC-2 type transport system ATP-binding protein [Micromonospora phaseoli]GIJ77590.1 daunorubicin resistance protein DrrA family ABC transporter ATP-binding protein [Micromonospora phaseoli]SEI68205.1 ABC-2 type transport system ATP-binding protein [Micromonospora phaseoli]
MVNAPPAVDLVDLRKSFGDVVVLDGLTMRVPSGGVHALLGQNGAGKTTTVRILATLTRPDSGSARVAGHDVVRERRQVRRVISLAGQHAALDDGQTGLENLIMLARLAGLSGPAARARAAALLERFDLADAAGRQAVTYSGGMRRRLDLAASLVGAPSVIFLDEPTTGLDPRSRQGLWEVIGELAGAGVTVLLTTQYLEEADRLADRIMVLHHGGLVADGTAAELKGHFGAQRLELTWRDEASFAEAARRLGDRTTHREPARLALSVATDGSAPQVRGLLDEIDPDRHGVVRFTVREATLDDVFLTLTGRPVSPPREVTNV